MKGEMTSCIKNPFILYPGGIRNIKETSEAWLMLLQHHHSQASTYLL